jgi:formylglycine-generating enzyme required for sulfatase activity
MAARGGTSTPWWSGNALTSAQAICADCGGGLPAGPAAVGGRQANPYHLYDVAGNVFEWTTDCSGTCIIRGGSYFNSKLHAQSGYVADRVPPSQQAPTLGFRVVRAATVN